MTMLSHKVIMLVCNISPPLPEWIWFFQPKWS